MERADDPGQMTLAKHGLVHFRDRCEGKFVHAGVPHRALDRFAIWDFAGESECFPEEMQKASVLVTINAGSLEIMDEVSSSDRREIGWVMFDEVLETVLGRRQN
jgi:hypothetical protein